MAQALPKDLDSILALPLTGIQSTLSRKLLEKSFTAADRDTAIAEIKRAASVQDQSILAQEERNIQAALVLGTAPNEPNLSTPELQLLWAAYLNVLACEPGSNLTTSPLWRQLKQCSNVSSQRMQHAVAMARDQFNPSTTLKWGEPGSMFYFEPQKNNINIDLLMSMCLGFENTRSIIFHEIGHSKLTVKLTDQMQAIYDEMEALQHRGEQATLTPDEYVRMHELSTLWKYKHRLYDEAENSPVNRYTINLAARVTPDPQESLDRALNTVETTLAQAGDQPPASANPTNIDKFRNLTRVIRMGLYKNNGLFKDTPTDWARIGVKPEWIEALPRTPNDPPPTPQEAFADLLHLCGGPYGLENLQPGTMDRVQGAAWLAAKTDEYADKRNTIIEDDLWARYAEPLVQPYVEQTKQQAQERVEQAQKGQSQGENQGEGQPGQGQPGEGQPGQGQPGQGQPGQGGGDPGSEPGEGPSPKGKPVNVDGAGSLPGIPVPEHPTKGKAGQKDKEKSEGEGEGKGDEGEEQGKGQAEGDGDSIQSILDKMDNEEQAAEQEGQDKGGEAGDAKDGKSSKSPVGGTSSKKSLPKVGEIADYEQLKRANAAEINQAYRLLKAIREKQSRLTARRTQQYEMIPTDGNMRRFSVPRHTDLVVKMAMGQAVTEHDAKQFRVDETTRTPAEINVTLLIDGSASMYWGSGDLAPIDAGINTGCVLNEAARKLNTETLRQTRERGINVWTVVWGNNPPLFITNPNDDPLTTGKAISGLNESLGWGTSLAPAIPPVVKAHAELKGDPQKPVGYNHFIVVSDGDIGDHRPSVDVLDKLLRDSPRTTFDVLVINERETTQMGNMVSDLQALHGDARVKLVPCQTAAQANTAILALLRERMVSTAQSQAITFEQRAKQLKKAHTSMTK